MSHRIINSDLIKARVIEAIGKLSFELDPKLLNCIRKLRQEEESEIALDILDSILENAEIARSEHIPPCQDTGTQVFFVDIGAQVCIEGASINTVINEAVQAASQQFYLRRTMVSDPLFNRSNSGDNTPAVIHYSIVEGDQLTIHLAQKGGGAENMSRLYMLNPSSSREDIIVMVVKTVVEAGAKACPPLILGIGIGGNFETAPLLAKRALFCEFDARNPEPFYAELEVEIAQRVNATGIGPMGMGGNCTVIAVHILQQACHIASLPLAVNLQCHAHRHLEIRI